MGKKTIKKCKVGKCRTEVTCHLTCVLEVGSWVSSCLVLKVHLYYLRISRRVTGCLGSEVHPNRCWNREENSPIVWARGDLAKQTALREVSQAFKAGRVGVMACFDFPIHQETHCVWAVMSPVTSLCGLDGRP